MYVASTTNRLKLELWNKINGSSLMEKEVNVYGSTILLPS